MRLLVTSGCLLPGDDIKEPAAEEGSLNSPEESEDSEGPFLVGWDSAGINFLTFLGGYSASGLPGEGDYKFMLTPDVGYGVCCLSHQDCRCPEGWSLMQPHWSWQAVWQMS